MSLSPPGGRAVDAEVYRQSAAVCSRRVQFSVAAVAIVRACITAWAIASSLRVRLNAQDGMNAILIERTASQLKFRDMRRYSICIRKRRSSSFLCSPLDTGSRAAPSRIWHEPKVDIYVMAHEYISPDR